MPPRHNLARLTVTTLGYGVLVPGRLQGVQILWRAEAFDGGNGAAGHCRDRRDTGLHGGTINMHGAGSTKPGTAAELGAFELEVVPYDPQ